MPTPPRKRAMPDTIPSLGSLPSIVALHSRDITQIDGTLREFMEGYRRDRQGDAQETAASRAKMEVKLDAIADRLSQHGKPNYGYWFSAFSGLAILVAVAYSYIDLSNKVALAPVLAMAEVSKSERAINRTDITKLSELINSHGNRMENFQTAIENKLVEVETQFRAVAQLQNQESAHNDRFIGLLWGKVYNEPLPMSRFYPDMSQPKPRGAIQK